MASPPTRRNAAMALGLTSVIAGMVGLSFAAVPLYRLFCAVTGYGGTPQIGPQASPGAVSRMITVRFNADVNGALPWTFQPVVPEVKVHLGEEQLAFYEARNQARGAGPRPPRAQQNPAPGGADVAKTPGRTCSSR